MAAEMLSPEKIELCPADYRAGAWGAVAVGVSRSVSGPISANFAQKEPMALAK